MRKLHIVQAILATLIQPQGMGYSDTGQVSYNTLKRLRSAQLLNFAVSQMCGCIKKS